jgi:hypothetical protein
VWCVCVCGVYVCGVVCVVWCVCVVWRVVCVGCGVVCVCVMCVCVCVCLLDIVARSHCASRPTIARSLH